MYLLFGEIPMRKNDCQCLYLIVHKIVCFISFEWFLSRNKSNGGTIIFLRALAITITITLLAMLLNNWINPELVSPITWINFRTQLVGLAPWSAALFAGSYVALYTRFSAQWSYLANLYNLIKQSEIAMYGSQGTSENIAKQQEILKQWKAGYIEDALELHLAAKSNVAGVISAWSKDPGVKEEFCENTFSGTARWEQLMVDIKIVNARENGQ